MVDVADNTCPSYALIDCNNCFASVEVLFRPELRGRPVVVLSNNDGCIIARSQEAKDLGLRMGDPYFKVRALLEEHKVVSFSSNYALYGAVTDKVTQTIAGMVESWERYSVDELFGDLSGLPEPLSEYCREIQSRVLRWTGMRVGIGIGHTKTLAKAAQHASKVWRDKTGGVVDLRSQHAVEWLLKRMPVDEVWGVGRRLKMRLADEGVHNAWQLSQLDAAGVKRRYSVVLERTVRELRGESCLDLEESEPDKQSICCSRMFGERITTLSDIKSAVATYVDRAAGKLRKQSSLAGHIQVGIQTSFHGDGPKYARSIDCALPYPTDDVRILTASAMHGLEVIFREGFKYSKAEVLLVDLRKRGEFTGDLFDPGQPPAADAVMAVLDQVNAKWGRGTLRTAAVAVDPRWAMRRNLLSPSYLTDIEQLWKVKAI
jgi:DNA polymerase V